MTAAYVILATAAGVVGIAAAVVFFALWRIAARRRRYARRLAPYERRAVPRQRRGDAPTVEMRQTGGARSARHPHEPLPAGETVVLPLQPAPARRPGRVNGSL